MQSENERLQLLREICILKLIKNPLLTRSRLQKKRRISSRRIHTARRAPLFSSLSPKKKCQRKLFVYIGFEFKRSKMLILNIILQFNITVTKTRETGKTLKFNAYRNSQGKLYQSAEDDENIICNNINTHKMSRYFVFMTFRKKCSV